MLRSIIAALAGFGKPTFSWPRWFPWTLAAMGVAGAALAARRGPESGAG